jgi:hypothetical protein
MLKTVDSLLLLVLYANDFLVTGFSTSTIAAVKRILHEKFLMTDMGLLHFFLGIEINQDSSDIKLSQAKYSRDLLETSHMKYCKSTPNPFLSGVKLEDGRDTPLVDNTLYKYLVWRYLYLTHSRKNLSYVVGAVSRFMQESHEIHWKDGNCILRYIQGTITFWIHYATDSTLDLIRFTNSDRASDNIDRNSTFNYSMSLGFDPICWSSKKQDATHVSLVKVEYRWVVNKPFRLCGYNIFSLIWEFSFIDRSSYGVTSRAF